MKHIQYQKGMLIGSILSLVAIILAAGVTGSILVQESKEVTFFNENYELVTHKYNSSGEETRHVEFHGNLGMLGCTDEDASNYNPLATINNGSCICDCTWMYVRLTAYDDGDTNSANGIGVANTKLRRGTASKAGSVATDGDNGDQAIPYGSKIWMPISGSKDLRKFVSNDTGTAVWEKRATADLRREYKNGKLITHKSDTMDSSTAWNLSNFNDKEYGKELNTVDDVKKTNEYDRPVVDVWSSGKKQVGNQWQWICVEKYDDEGVWHKKLGDIFDEIDDQKCNLPEFTKSKSRFNYPTEFEVSINPPQSPPEIPTEAGETITFPGFGSPSNSASQQSQNNGGNSASQQSQNNKKYNSGQSRKSNNKTVSLGESTTNKMFENTSIETFTKQIHNPDGSMSTMVTRKTTTSNPHEPQLPTDESLPEGAPVILAQLLQKSQSNGSGVVTQQPNLPSQPSKISKEQKSSMFGIVSSISEQVHELPDKDDKSALLQSLLLVITLLNSLEEVE